MITVAGFNTAIDRAVDLDDLVPGRVQRACAARQTPGGKGLHVAQTIAALGEPVRLVGLVDAAHGALIEDWLAQRGVAFHGVAIDGDLRVCTALREADGRITEILEPGPVLDDATRARLLQTLLACVDDSDLVVLSGSLPRGFSDDAYAQILIDVGARLPCFVDTSGAALRLAIDRTPFLAKPNRDEAEALAGRGIAGVADAARAAQALHTRGIAWPVITLGALGAVATDGNAVLHATIAATPGGHPVGSGDCFLAGMAVARARGGDLTQALRLGVACGAANAATPETGYVQRALVDALLEKTTVTALTLENPE